MTILVNEIKTYISVHTKIKRYLEENFWDFLDLYNLRQINLDLLLDNNDNCLSIFYSLPKSKCDFSEKTIYRFDINGVSNNEDSIDINYYISDCACGSCGDYGGDHSFEIPLLFFTDKEKFLNQLSLEMADINKRLEKKRELEKQRKESLVLKKKKEEQEKKEQEEYAIYLKVKNRIETAN